MQSIVFQKANPTLVRSGSKPSQHRKQPPCRARLSRAARSVTTPCSALWMYVTMSRSRLVHRQRLTEAVRSPPDCRRCRCRSARRSGSCRRRARPRCRTGVRSRWRRQSTEPAGRGRSVVFAEASSQSIVVVEGEVDRRLRASTSSGPVTLAESCTSRAECDLERIRDHRDGSVSGVRGGSRSRPSGRGRE